MFAENPNYKDPKLIEKIVKLRQEGKTWLNISQEIEKEFGFRITSPTCKNIYERQLAKSMLVEEKKSGPQAKEVLSDYQKRMEERFNRVAKITDDLMDMMEELKERVPSEVYVKYIPTILMVCREVLNQLNYIKKDQQTLIVNQKNLIYSPLQIMKVINSEIDKNPRIKIVNTVPTGLGEEGRVLTSEEMRDLSLSRIRTPEEIEADEKERKLKKKLEEEENEA